MNTSGSVRRSLVASGLVAGIVIAPLVAATPAAAVNRLCGPPSDTVSPQVSVFSLDTDAVDVTDAPATITVTAHATDTTATGDPSGVKRVFAYFSTHRGFL